jgi:hypothetical protein
MALREIGRKKCAKSKVAYLRAGRATTNQSIGKRISLISLYPF